MDKNTKESRLTKKRVKSIIAEHLGVESSDIEDDDSFSQDLHMSPSDIFDLFEVLKEKGICDENCDYSEAETVSDLLEELGIND